MEISLDKLSRNKDPRAESLHAFINGLVQLDYATVQHGYSGATVPWSQLVKFNHFQFPAWEDTVVEGFLELSGEFLASVDRSFNSQIHKLLDVEPSRGLVFDLPHAKIALPDSSLAFLYSSGLISWFIPRDHSEEQNLWLMSVKDPNTLCIYQESCDKYIYLGVNNSEAVNLQLEDYPIVLDYLCKHILWHREAEYVFAYNQIDPIDVYIPMLAEKLKDVYEVSAIFGQLCFTRIGG